ncbi:MAG: crossover junction endodeoxyribonuclease RuvC [Bdellovibrionales bacterium]|nr:crossover junction endodeoxyribonuclease RuvC [Bdellovibrionales bacterium]
MKDLILGVDPGSRNTGFGVVEVSGSRVSHVEHGVITLKESWPLPERLKQLQAELHNLYTRYEIRTTVVEKIFFGKNADSAFKLGHARGVCLLVSAQHGSEVAEYAARYVKKCVTGSGAASKDHVQMVVFNLLRVAQSVAKFDASDALALALTHSRVREVEARLKRAMEGSV